MALPSTIVPSPPVNSVPFGLFSAIVFRDNEERRSGASATIETLKGGVLNTYGALDCAEPTGNAQLPKKFTDTVSQDIFEPFSVYGTYDCSIASASPEKASKLAVERVQKAEEITAENYLWSTVLANAQKVTEVTKLFGSANLTLPVTDAVAVLEHYIARYFPEGGVIHVPRAFAGDLKHTRVSNQRLYSLGGVPIVLGGGYLNTPADDGDGAVASPVIVATPTLFGYRSDIEVLDPVRSADLGHNDYKVVAEREYLIGYGSGQPVALSIKNPLV